MDKGFDFFTQFQKIQAAETIDKDQKNPIRTDLNLDIENINEDKD
jgi:hypothetical protein